MAVLEIVGVLLAGVVGCLWLSMLWLGQLNRHKRAPPGSLGWPLVGETLQFVLEEKAKYPHLYAEKRRAKYGPVFTTHHMGYPCVMSIDPEVNRFILQNEGKYFLSNYPRSLINIFGEGAIIRAYGDLHKRLHNVVLSFNNSPKLKEHVMTDVDYLIKTAMSDWGGRTVSAQEELKTIAFNVVARYLLGLMPGEECSYLYEEFKKCIDGIISIPIKIPGTPYYKSLKAKEKCVKVMKRIMEEKRRRPQTEHLDIIGSLMVETDNNGKQLPDEIICNTIMNLLGAGQTTASMALMCAVKHISECPRALEQLREEHFALRRRKGPGEPVTWDDYTNHMTFTQHVINETLRITNPAGGVLRKAIQDVEVKGYFIPKNWLVFPFFINVHLDENVYPDAFTFNPWRWEKKIPSLYFTPFGGGPRVCSAQELARREISVLIHYLVTKFKWVLDDDEQINFPAVRFKKLLPMTVEPLQQ